CCARDSALLRKERKSWGERRTLSAASGSSTCDAETGCELPHSFGSLSPIPASGCSRQGGGVHPKDLRRCRGPCEGGTGASGPGSPRIKCPGRRSESGHTTLSGRSSAF